MVAGVVAGAVAGAVAGGMSENRSQPSRGKKCKHNVRTQYWCEQQQM